MKTSPDAGDLASARSSWSNWALLLLICWAGAALRLWRLGAPADDPLSGLPPGLYHDEAFNGLDALSVIGGARPIYFPANHGREPLFLYLQAASVAAFGRSAFALRLPAAFVGVLMVPAAYALGRRLFGHRAALLAAAVMAWTFWPVSISRIGLRAQTLPLLAALALAAAWSAFARRSAWRAAAGGALYGLSFYTYLAARLTPAAFGLLALCAWLGRRPRPHWRGVARPAAAFCLSASLVAAPLLIYAAQNPDIFFERSSDLSITGQPDFLRLLGANTLKTAGMFWVTGDSFSRPRHNIPGRPLFDPLMGAAALAGLWVCLRGPRRREARAATLIWTGVMLLPTILTVEAPYFLRTVGILPWICFLPALGLEVGWQWLGAKGRGTWGAAGVTAALLASLGLTAYSYFEAYAHDPHLPFSYEAAAQSLAGEVARAEGVVYVDGRYWRDFTSVRFLVEGVRPVTVFEEGQPLSPLSPAFPGEAPRVSIFIWPYGEVLPALSGLPADSLIGARRGPLFKNDLDAEPWPFYSVYTAHPREPAPPAAVFQNGMALQSAEITPAAGGVQLRLVWAAGPAPQGEYHVFVQAVEDGVVMAQADGAPADWLYPTSWWRPGDWVEDLRLLPLVPSVRTTFIVGLYNPLSQERLRLESGADFVELTNAK